MFENLTLAQLSTVYNAAQELLGRDERVSKFRDRATGIARLEKAQQSLVDMHGQAVLGDDLTWDVTTRKPGARLTTSLDLSAPLRVLCEKNPKRPGSKSHALFELYSDCPNGAEFIKRMIAAGATRKHAMASLHWDIGHKFIQLGE